MESTRFDRLTKALAGAASRRQALKALTVAAVGGVIGVRSTGTAYANSNRSCAHFCDAVFGDDTRAARQCRRDAARGSGLCYTCGPASPGGGVAPSAICCTRTRHGHCERYADAACCSSGQTCQHGNCVTTGSTTTHAPGRTTTSAPGRTTTRAPGRTTTQAPGLTTTQAPGLTTTHAPGLTTTQAPGLTTTQAPGLTTTQAPGLTTTQAPGLTTTHAPRPTTTQAPGPTTTQAPGLTTTHRPRHTTTHAPRPTTTIAL